MQSNRRKRPIRSFITMILSAALLVTTCVVPYRAKAEDVPDVTERCGLEELTDVELSDEEAEALLIESYSDEDEVEPVYSGDWDQYGSDYIYDTYLTDDEQAFYDSLETMCKKYMDSTDDLETTKVDDGVTYYLMDYVSYGDLDYDDAKGLIYIFVYQNPQYWFINTKFFHNTSYVCLTCYSEFADGDARLAATNSIFTKVDSWIREIQEEPTTVDKEKKAHDIVCVNVDYLTGADYNQSAYSSVVLGESVCAGYTKMFSMLMNGSGIDTIGIISTAHGWNKSYIDGVWYNVDTTWDDYDTFFKYIYFNRSDSYFASGHSARDFYMGRVPEAASDHADRPTTTTTAVEVTGVTLNQTSASIAPTGTLQLSAAVSPDSATDDAVVWTSSDTSVATVSESGLVTAKKAGTAIITVTTNNCSKTASCSVTVSGSSAGGSITSQTTTTEAPVVTPKTDATVSASGVYLAEHSHNRILAGLVTSTSKNADLEYRWLLYNDSTGGWDVISGWKKNNEWLDWNPGKSGDFVIVGQVRVVGNEDSQAQGAIGINHHQQIKGMCQMPYTGDGGGYLIGVESYDNPGGRYSYELLVLDCTLLAQGKDAWIWSTGRCGTVGNAFWAIWQPQYGYYWTLFRVYDENGTIIDEQCYPFVNAY